MTSLQKSLIGVVAARGPSRPFRRECVGRDRLRWACLLAYSRAIRLSRGSQRDDSSKRLAVGCTGTLHLARARGPWLLAR
jgi:hypothetical protein